MSYDYQLRKDINRVITFLNNLEKIEDDDSILALLKEELGKYYDSSEVDVVTGKLNDDLTELHSSLGDLTDGLVEFNGELIAFDESNTNLKGDLSKLKQNLQKFTAAVNKLKVDLKGLDEKSDEFDEDLWGEGGLDERLTSLGVKIGNDDSGLVKGLNDLTDGLSKLENDVFGTNGLSSSVSGLSAALGSDKSGLIKDLNELDAYTKEFYDDVYGTNGLSTQLSTLEGVINNPTTGLAAQVTGLDNRVFGTGGLSDNVFGTNGLSSQLSTLEGIINNPTTGLAAQLTGLDSRVFGANGLSESIFGTNGLASRIGTAEGGLSNLTDSLDTLVEFLTNFEGTLDDFEEALEEDSNIDTSELNSSITALLGLIAGVKKDVDVVDGNLTDVSNSFDGVKSNLYGTKTVTIDGQSVTVPKDPTDSPSSTSLRGHLDTLKDTTVPAVQNTLYGGSGNSPDNPSSTSLMGKTNAVKADLYGTKTVNGKTVPKEPNDTASSDSLSGHLTTLRDTTVPAVQNTLYGGEGNSPSSPSANSLMGKTNAVKADLYGSTNGVPNDPSNASSNSFKTTIEHLRDTTVPEVRNAANNAQTSASNIKGDLYGTKTVNGQTVPREPSEASSTSFKTTVTTLRDTTVPAVQGEIFGTDSQGNPLNSTNYSDDSILGKSDELKSDMYGTKTVNGQTVPKDKNDKPDDNSLRGLIKSVDEDINDPTNGLDARVTGLNGQINDSITGIGAVNDHIGTIQTHMYGGEGHSPTSYTDGSLMGKIHTAEGNIETVQGDIGDVDRSVNSDLQNQINIIISLFNELLIPIPEVDSLPIYDEYGQNIVQVTTPPSTKHEVPQDYNYQVVKVKSTGKYYKLTYVEGH